MQGQQNSVIKQQLINEIKQFESKQQMVRYYMSYDFPEKQRGVKGWWQDLIQIIIKKKGQIYVTFKDLQAITSINGLKPIPLKNILKQLKQEYVFVKEEDITMQKKPQKKAKPWYTSIISFAWTSNQKDQVDFPFTFNPQEKIISINAKQRKKKELLGLLHKEFQHENSKFMRNLMKQLSGVLKIDQISVQILLKQLKAQKQLVMSYDENFGDQIIIYNSDRKKMSDENFIKVEKIKCSLKGSLQRYDLSYEKSTSKIADMRQKAKNAAMKSDKNKARVIVAQMKKQEDHREKIQVQKQVLQLKINQIQVNQMNKSSYELLKQAQSAYQQVAVDQQKFEQVIQRAREIQMQSDQNTKRFQELAASQQIEEEVDDMMKEIEQEMSKKKLVEPKTVDVITEDKPQRLVFEKAQQPLDQT